MKRGAAISGTIHAAILGVALFGVDWFSTSDAPPLLITEIELIDGVNFEAAASTAPIVPNEGPSELAPPADSPTDPGTVEQPQDSAQRAETVPQPVADAPEPKPDRPEIAFPPPPTDVPTEAPAPSIAEIPSPDPLDRQSVEPESPASTEPVQPVASAPPIPQAKPTPPPPPEPEPQQVEPEPAVAETPEPEAVAEAKPDPEPSTRPDPDSQTEAQPEAPEGPAPRESAIPVAKPAALAAAARAAAAAEQAQQQAEAKPDKPAKPAATKPQQAGGSTARLATKLTRSDIKPLRLGIKKYYTYNGNRSDPSLAVIVRIRLDKTGKMRGNPELRSGTGGTPALQKQMFQAARRALIRANNANVFKKLPVEKYERWKVLNFRFTIDNNKIGVSS